MKRIGLITAFLTLFSFLNVSSADIPQKVQKEQMAIPECSTGAYLGAYKLLTDIKWNWITPEKNVLIYVNINGKVTKALSRTKDYPPEDILLRLYSATFSDEHCVIRLYLEPKDETNKKTGKKNKKTSN
jgi:hypothetical protein